MEKYVRLAKSDDAHELAPKVRQEDLRLKEEKLRLEFLEKQRIRQEQQRAKIEKDELMSLFFLAIHTPSKN